MLGLERLEEVSLLGKLEKNSFLFSASSSPKKLNQTYLLILVPRIYVFVYALPRQLNPISVHLGNQERNCPQTEYQLLKAQMFG